MRCCFLVCLFSFALAAQGSADTQDGAFTGAYLGGQAGYLLGDGDAGTVGLHLGYSASPGAPLVLGVELELDATDRRLDGTDQRVDSLARLKLRAGGRAGDTLLYGLGGVSMLDSGLGNARGGMIGAGGEIDLGDGRSVGIELTHEHFGEIGSSGRGLNLTGLSFRAGLRF